MAKSRASGSSSETDRVFSARISPELVKMMKILAAEKDTSIKQLLNEAVKDLLKKYRKL